MRPVRAKPCWDRSHAKCLLTGEIQLYGNYLAYGELVFSGFCMEGECKNLMLWREVMMSWASIVHFIGNLWGS